MPEGGPLTPLPAAPAAVSARALLLGLAAGGGLLAGCDTQQACNPAIEVCDGSQGGSIFAGDDAISRVQAGCCAPDDDDPRCPTEGGWWYDLVLEGAVRSAAVTIHQPADFPAVEYEERHTLPVVQADPDGFWENRYRELAVVDDEACRRPGECADRVISGVTTAFPCLDEAEERWQWRMDLFDRDGEVLACATWGLRAVAWAPTCREVSP